MLQYNNDATIYGANFSDGDLKVIHCLHEQKPSVFFQFWRKLDKYIEYRHAEDPDFPDKRNMVEAILRCKFMFNKGDVKDEDGHCLFKPWRSAVYCDGDKECVKQLLMFLDGFVHWYSRLTDEGQDEFVEPLKLDIELPVGFSLDFETPPEEGEPQEMDCQFSLSYPEDRKTKVTDSPPPCFPARMLVATIEAVSKNAVSIVWRGNSKPFRAQFEELGIGGKSMKRNPSDKFGEYFRKIENLTVHEVGDRDKIEAMPGDGLAKNTPIVVRIRSHPADDDDFLALIKALKKKNNCFFVK